MSNTAYHVVRTITTARIYQATENTRKSNKAYDIVAAVITDLNTIIVT